MQFFKSHNFTIFCSFAAGLLDQPIPLAPQALNPTSRRSSSDEDVIFVTTAGPSQQQPLPQATPLAFVPQLPPQPQPVQYVQQSYPANPMNFAQAFHQQTGRTLQYVTSIPIAAPPGSIGVNPGQAFQYPVFHQPLNYMTPAGHPFVINQGLPTPTPNLIYAASSQQSHIQPSQIRPPPMQQTFHFPTTPSNPIFRQPPNAPVEKKIARVQPQVHSQQSSSVASTSRSGKIDPIKALSSMASQPMTSTSSANNLSISHQHQSRPSSLSLEIHNEHQRSVGTQAKIGAPVKIISPRPWKSHHIGLSMQDNIAGGGNMSSGVSTSTSRFVIFSVHNFFERLTFFFKNSILDHRHVLPQSKKSSKLHHKNLNFLEAIP